MGEKNSPMIKPKPGDVVELPIGISDAAGLRYVLRLDVFRVYEETGIYILRVDRVRQEKVQKCPCCEEYRIAEES